MDLVWLLISNPATNRRLWLSLMVIAILMPSCVELEEPESLDTAQEVVFSLAPYSIGYNTIKVEVTHTGTNRDKYVVFSTEDLHSSIDELTKKYLSDNSLSGVLLEQKKKIYPMRELKPDTEYRIIAFGVDVNGIMYGIPSELRVTTSSCPWIPEINDAWRLTHQGEYKVSEYEAMSVVRIDVDEDCKEVFCLRAYKRSFFESFSSISDVIEYTVNNYISEKYWNWWEDSTDIYRSSTTTYWSLFDGDWIIVAAGLNQEGIPTGKYNLSSWISPDLKVTAPRYYDWLGDWSVQGTDVILTFKTNNPNENFKISGWNGLDEELRARYYPEEDSIAIYCQKVYSSELEYAGVKEEVDYYLRGLFLDNEGDWNFYITTASYSIAQGDKEHDQIVLKGVNYGYDNDVVFDSMGFVALHSASEEYFISHNRKEIHFPLNLCRL